MKCDCPLCRRIGPSGRCPYCGQLLYGDAGHSDNCGDIKKTIEGPSIIPECFGTESADKIECPWCEYWALCMKFYREHLPQIERERLEKLEKELEESNVSSRC